MEIKVDTIAEAYSILRDKLLLSPVYSPRGLSTREITNVTIELTNPRSRIGYHHERNWSLYFAVAEAVMLFNHTNKIDYIGYINPRMYQFSDDNRTLYGYYGHRIAHNMDEIVVKLQKDPDTRQAILGIYNSTDLVANSKDIPCTIALQFLIRNNKLDLYVTMRSNDFVWGFPYDVFQFTILQEVIANELKIDLGSYYHRVTSLHYYVERHHELLKKIEKVRPVEFSLSYKISDMWELSLDVMRLKEDVPIGKGMFKDILRILYLKKHGMVYSLEYLKPDLLWAKDLLR